MFGYPEELERVNVRTLSQLMSTAREPMLPAGT